MSWIAVVPVKGGQLSKSRLLDLAEHGFPARETLAQAFAADTVSALLDVPSISTVIVVTEDAHAARELARIGAVIVPEKMLEARLQTLAPDDPLNRAITSGIDVAGRFDPDAGILVVTGDLPTIQPVVIEALLVRAAEHRLSMVADAEGTGTTILLAAPASPASAAAFTPRFGIRSRDAHERAGHVVLDAPPALRRDIDTADELREAIAIGVGPRTTGVLASTPGDATPRGNAPHATPPR